MILYAEILQLIHQIREDRTHGASELARQAVQVFEVLADITQAENGSQLWQEIQAIAGLLKSVRPSMAPIYNAVSHLVQAVSSASSPDAISMRYLLKTKAGETIRSSLQAASAIAGYTDGLSADKDTIFTHSYSSTVTRAIISAHRNHEVKVIVTRSGAGRTGIRTALELNEAGIEVTFIDDTAAGIYVSRANKVMVGADRVCRDGGLVNGVGTYLIALAAEKASAPFYVLCDTWKFDPLISSSQAELEENEASEVIGAGIFKADVTVKNPYFDITPLNLVTAFITENGLIEPRDLDYYFTCNP